MPVDPRERAVALTHDGKTYAEVAKLFNRDRVARSDGAAFKEWSRADIERLIKDELTEEAEAPAEADAQPTAEVEASSEPTCWSCRAPLSDGTAFCGACGSPAVEPTADEEDSPHEAPTATLTAEISAAPVAVAATATAVAMPTPASHATPAAPGTPSATSTTASKSFLDQFLLPRFPVSMFWNPRNDYVVTTKLSGAEVAGIFSERMTKRTNILRMANSYFRNVRWEVQRNAISGEVVAYCRPTGLVKVGFGRSATYFDVSNNSIHCGIATEEDKTVATITVGGYTVGFGFLYVYPAPLYLHSIVRLIRKADPDAHVKYPWSIFRMVAWAVVFVWLLTVVA